MSKPPATIHQFPKACTDKGVRTGVTLAEVPGFLTAVREARELRPDVPRQVFVLLARRRHPSWHPILTEVTGEVLARSVDLYLSQQGVATPPPPLNALEVLARESGGRVSVLASGRDQIAMNFALADMGLSGAELEDFGRALAGDGASKLWPRSRAPLTAEFFLGAAHDARPLADGVTRWRARIASAREAPRGPLRTILASVKNTRVTATSCFLTGAEVPAGEGYACLFSTGGRWFIVSEAAWNAAPKASRWRSKAPRAGAPSSGGAA